MQIALIGDLHGNWPATQAVDADIARRGIERIYCLGDMVGKGPSSARTLDWALTHCEVALAGNWDLAVLRSPFASGRYVARQLGEARLAAIRRLPMEHRFWLAGRHIRLLHGRPITPELVLPNQKSTELTPLFVAHGLRFDMVGYADIHRHWMRVLDDAGYLFNTGSVGNSIGDTNAHYAILTGEMGEGSASAPFDLTFVTLPYDRDRAIEDALAADDLPNRQAYIREIQTGIYSR